MFRNLEPLIEFVKTTAYVELARNRGQNTTVVIHRDAEAAALLFKTFTRHPKYLPAAVTLMLKDDKREFIPIQGTGTDKYNLFQLVDLVETRIDYMTAEDLKLCTEQVMLLARNHPEVLMGIIGGNPATQANDPMIMDANSRFFMASELLKHSNDAACMKRFYDNCSASILTECVNTFGELDIVLNAFTPDSGYRAKILKNLGTREDVLQRMMANQLDDAAARQKLAIYFPDKSLDTVRVFSTKK